MSSGLLSLPVSQYDILTCRTVSTPVLPFLHEMMVLHPTDGNQLLL